jgi:hypothetical protein
MTIGADNVSNNYPYWKYSFFDYSKPQKASIVNMKNEDRNRHSGLLQSNLKAGVNVNACQLWITT